MGITRAQIARQLLAEGGMPMKEIKGQNHMLAYITPNEADKLVRLGGQETMTPEGIPAYPEYDNYGYSNQADFDQGNYAASSDPTVSGYADRNMSDDDLKALSYAVKPNPKKSFKDKVMDSFRKIGKYSPTVNMVKGIGGFFRGAFDKLANLRGFNPNGTRRTQKQFERARDIRRTEKSISNILGRDREFTDLTIDRLEDLYESLYGKGNVPSNINDSLIGTTNTTRSGTSDQNFPDPVEGIVSQVGNNPTFRDAMTNLNLELGVPRDEVFLTEAQKNYINENKAISSEDLGPIENFTTQNIKNSTGYGSELAKTFGLEQLLAAKAGEKGFFGGLTEKGKALEDFRNSAVNFKNAPGNPNNTAQSAFQFMMDPVRQNMFKDVQQNKDYIQEQINQGFLENPEDYINQKALGSYF